MEGIELPNPDKIRTLGIKETYRYLGILESDSIKQAEMKEKNKNTSGEWENESKPSYIAEISSKGLIPNCLLREILRTIFKVYQRRIPTNRR